MWASSYFLCCLGLHIERKKFREGKTRIWKQRSGYESIVKEGDMMEEEYICIYGEKKDIVS